MVIWTISYKISICRKKTLFTWNKITRIVSVVCFPFCLIRGEKNLNCTGFLFLFFSGKTKGGTNKRGGTIAGGG